MPRSGTIAPVGGAAPPRLLMWEPANLTEIKILRDNLCVDGGRGRDEGLLGGGSNNALGVEGGRVGSDGNFLFSDAIHGGEFVSGFDAVIGGDVIVSHELEEEGSEVNFEGVRVEGGGFFHFGAYVEPVGVSFKAVDGGLGGFLGDFVDVHVGGKEGAFVFILVAPYGEVAALVRGE